MKFDFCIGNPPYQDDRQGDSTTALPVYHQFMEAAYQVGTAVELITPARFLFNAGRTPKKWNEKMLNDPYLSVLDYEADGSKVFPSTEIKGGVVITYRDTRNEHHSIGVFTIYPELNAILARVQSYNEPSFSELGFVASKFNSEQLFADYPQYAGHERRMSSNVLAFECFHDVPKTKDVRIYGIYGKSKNRSFRAIDEKYVDLSDANIRRFKIVMPKADGNGTFGDTLTMPEVIPPRTGFTHTFLGVGGFDSEDEAIDALKYIKTKFFRALLGVLKVTQDLNADKFNYIPLQDFTPASDIDWSRSIPDIDRQLYAKYGLDEAEIEFIEIHVKAME